ncbi:hypothetical protein MFIFM68171_08145 [Madurella fahalii]|uniref:Uncharacterized protein n=1 Tax=Madurella fahalii TaxID=1157608 RepID=A0ABQ0GJP4_9PEZI
MAMYYPRHFFGSRAGSLLRRQNFDPATMCLPGTITSLPNCDNLAVMQTRIQELRNQQVSDEELARYVCTQDILNAHVGCKNDIRQCMLTTEFDAEWDTTIAEWNEACRPYFTATPTTPADIRLTATHDGGSCQSAFNLCMMWDAADSSCSSSHTSLAELSSCLCRSDIIAFASKCEVDGSVSCYRQTPNPASMWGAIYCSVTPTIPSATGGEPFIPIIGPTTVSFERS